MALASVILASLSLVMIMSQNFPSTEGRTLIFKNENYVQTSTNMFDSSVTGITYAKDAVVSTAMEATPPAPAATLPHTSPPGEAELGNHGKKTMEENDIPAGPEHQFAVAPPTPSDDIVSEGEVTSNKTMKKEPNA